MDAKIDTRDPSYKGMVYFMQVGKSGPIKIGWTHSNLNVRFNNIQGNMPYELRIIGFIMCKTDDYEQQLHIKFDHLRIRGEWFKPGVRLRSFISKNAERYSSQYVNVEMEEWKHQLLKKIAKAQKITVCRLVQRGIQMLLDRMEDKIMDEPGPRQLTMF